MYLLSCSTPHFSILFITKYCFGNERPQIFHLVTGNLGVKFFVFVSYKPTQYGGIIFKRTVGKRGKIYFP